MRRLALVVVVLSALSVALPSSMAAQSRVRDSVTGIDKMKHFLIAGFVESVTFAGLRAAGMEKRGALASGVAVTVTLSIGREVHDRRSSGLFSFGDLLWDALGVGAAALILSHTR